MKKFLLSVFAFTMVSFSFAQDQTADQIVDKYIAAIGGKEAWSKVKSMVMTGTMKVQGTDIGIVATVLDQKGMKQEISVNGMTGYQIVTPVSGWNFMPFQGQKEPEPITADDLKESQEQLDVKGNLIDYKAKGHSIELLGTDDVDGVEALKLKETLKSGKVETIYIDPATYYIIRVVSKQKANGQEQEVTSDLSNYQKLPEGIVVPMSVKLPFGEMTLTKVDINKDIDEKIFAPSKS
ncbi:MAG: hypothetical protein ABIN25_09640 [Ginsengibacter sp.]